MHYSDSIRIILYCLDRIQTQGSCCIAVNPRHPIPSRIQVRSLLRCGNYVLNDIICNVSKSSSKMCLPGGPHDVSSGQANSYASDSASNYATSLAHHHVNENPICFYLTIWFLGSGLDLIFGLFAPQAQGPGLWALGLGLGPGGFWGVNRF